MEEFRNRIFGLQSQRQTDVWTLLERAVISLAFNWSTHVIACLIFLFFLFLKVTLWQCTSMMNQQPSLPHATSATCLSTREMDSQESIAVIQENKHLRYQ